MLKGCVPCEPEYAKLYRELGLWEDKTLGEVLEQRFFKDFRDRECVVYEGRRYTYKQVGEVVNRLASHFLKLGLKPQDRVVFQLGQTPENMFTFLALIKAGIIPVMALPAHRFNEINHFVHFANAVATFTPTKQRKFDFMEMIEQVRAEQKSVKYIFVQGEATKDYISIEELINTPVEHIEPPPIDPDEVVFMLLSGGTTGIPKLIPRTHNDYHYNIRQSSLEAHINSDTVFLAILPMGHNFTIGCPGYMSSMYRGGKTVICPAMDEDTIFSLVEKERVTDIAAAVPLIARWRNSDIPDKYDLSSLKSIMNGGAALTPEFRKSIIDRFKCFPLEVFGTGEGLLIFMPREAPKEKVLTSSGKAISPYDDLKVIDLETGEVLPPGEAGELVVRGPYTIHGYYNMPEKNKEAFTDDGYYKMGDVVKMDEEGYVYYVGRNKDLVNRGGEKISCEEVEGFIMQNDKVDNCCVVAMPDEEFGERACAYVKLNPGQTIDLKELVAFLKSKDIANFKLPERLEIVDAFPLTAFSKISRKDLRDRIAAQVKAEKAAKGQ